MSVLLEDKIKKAILSVRWKQLGDGPNPNYFVSATQDSYQLGIPAAKFLASFIADYITNSTYEVEEDPAISELDKYSLEMMASYLEEKGFTVSLPG
jgi:hypothetical protein